VRDEVDDPALQQAVDVHAPHASSNSRKSSIETTGSRSSRGVHVALLVEDVELVLGARIPERGLQEEAVELRLRERKGSLVFDRVLGRKQEERVGELPRDAVHRHLSLRHGLEQRRLRLRHRTIYLVDEARRSRRSARA
jgi:hypothetical protein